MHYSYRTYSYGLGVPPAAGVVFEERIQRCTNNIASVRWSVQLSILLKLKTGQAQHWLLPSGTCRPLTTGVILASDVTWVNRWLHLTHRGIL